MDVAAERVKNDWLQLWWRKKYNRPSKDPLLAEYTREELYVEYLEEGIDLHGGLDEMEEAASAEDKVTPEIEKKIDAGEDVDLLRTLPDDERARLERFMKRGAPPPSSEEFSDDYTKDEP